MCGKHTDVCFSLAYVGTFEHSAEGVHGARVDMKWAEMDAAAGCLQAISSSHDAYLEANKLESHPRQPSHLRQLPNPALLPSKTTNQSPTHQVLRLVRKSLRSATAVGVAEGGADADC